MKSFHNQFVALRHHKVVYVHFIDLRVTQQITQNQKTDIFMKPNNGVFDKLIKHFLEFTINFINFHKN